VRLVPTVRCSRMNASIAFYTEILGFRVREPRAEGEDPSFQVLERDGELLFLSSHDGDGCFGQAVGVLVEDVRGVYEELQERGLVLPDHGRSPVHAGPVDQTWGTREFYVDDPDGNTIRFIEGLGSGRGDGE
jgi:catechol 2,3-dioxygenase-like lactoylglutathione lyase family enzyme